MAAFLKEEEIVTGSVWRPCDGSSRRVRVVRVEDGDVFYADADKPTTVWDKDVWHFQVRYEPDES